MNANRISIIWVWLLWTGAAFAASATGVYNIRDFGAEPGGKTLCTQAIQQAVDRCAADGGGTVLIPPGKWLTGTVYLESRVTIRLENGATVLGSKDKSDYGRPRTPSGVGGEAFSSWAIFAGRNLDHVAICGAGVMDGQGANFKYKDGARPNNIYFEDCRDVLVEGVRLRNAGSWMQHYRNCDRVALRGIHVFNHISYNNDGLNIDSCRDVAITDCMVDSDDDAVVLKSMSAKPCENIVISNCVISSHCNAIKMGTESGGGFQNIAVTNCTIGSPRDSEVIYGRQRGLAGVALEIVDGGALDRVMISNLAIQGVTAPIFVRLGNRARVYEDGQPKPGVGRLRNVMLSNILATDCSPNGCSITGLPGHPVENITLSNLNLGFEGGGGRKAASREIPEKAEAYPESTMFGELPSYGFFCRHVSGLRFQNVRLQTSAPDQRHAVVLDDVRDGVVDSLDAPSAKGGAAMLRLADCAGVSIRNCRPPDETEVFLFLTGGRTDAIAVCDNNLAGANTAYTSGPEVPESAVNVWSNHMPR